MARTLPRMILLSCLAGCDAGPSNDEPSTECVTQESMLSLAEATALGFSGEQLLAAVGASHVATLTWGPAEGPAYFAIPGSTELSIGIAHAGGEVRYIEATPEGWCDGACADSCISRLEVDVTMSFASADGILDESWDVTLSSSSGDQASFDLRFDPDATEGDMSWQSFVIDDGFGFEPGGTASASGTLGQQTQGSLALELPLSGEGGGYYAAPVATWTSQ